MVVAFLYRRSVLPEIGVLRPATSALLAQHSGIALDHLVLLPGERPDVVIPYALTDVVGSWVLVVGVTVSSLMLLRRVAGTIAMRRTLARCTPVRRVEEEGLVEAVERLAAAAGMRQAPRLLMLPEGTPGAFARGAGGGQILLSRDLMDDLDTEELEAILAHEIAHLQARDTVLTFVAGLARDLVAWNPIAYLALRHLIVDRELEADRRAAELTGKPLAVASGLVKICDLLRRRGPHALRPSVLVGFGVLRRPIGRRVTRLLALAEGGVPAPAGANTWVPFLAAAGLAVALALQAGLTLARNDEALAVMWGTSDAHNP
ncbi:MAG: M48 family metalloprotease, partial [Actinomycetota bacterium]